MAKAFEPPTDWQAKYEEAKAELKKVKSDLRQAKADCKVAEREEKGAVAYLELLQEIVLKMRSDWAGTLAKGRERLSRLPVPAAVASELAEMVRRLDRDMTNYLEAANELDEAFSS